MQKKITLDDSTKIGKKLNINWSDISKSQWNAAMNVEMEHGTVDPKTNVSNDDLMITGKIALAHINEFTDYYLRLDQMEKRAKMGFPVCKNFTVVVIILIISIIFLITWIYL